MQHKTFKSENGLDQVNVSLFKKSHKGLFELVVIDNVENNIELLNEILQFLKQNDIKWVELKANIKPNIPQNAIFYPNHHNKHIICHITDFEKFYRSNLVKLVNNNTVKVEDPTQEDGWTMVMNKNKLIKNKINQIKKDIDDLLGDWNSMK